MRVLKIIAAVADLGIVFLAFGYQVHFTYLALFKHGEMWPVLVAGGTVLIFADHTSKP